MFLSIGPINLSLNSILAYRKLLAVKYLSQSWLLPVNLHSKMFSLIFFIYFERRVQRGLLIIYITPTCESYLSNFTLTLQFITCLQLLTQDKTRLFKKQTSTLKPKSPKRPKTPPQRTPPKWLFTYIPLTM